MADYISREAAIEAHCMNCQCIDQEDDKSACWCMEKYHISQVPAADVVEEENILKFYYVRSLDEYWIGRRLDTLYYAEYVDEYQCFVWKASRYLPWGEHVEDPRSLWKEYDYPSEPEEIPFSEWLPRFIKKHIFFRMGKWEEWRPGAGALILTGEEMLWQCSVCGAKFAEKSNFCPRCGADMREATP